MEPLAQRMKARSTTFSSSRMLPGQSWAMSRERASEVIPWTDFFCRALKCATNCSTRMGRSSFLFLSGGSSRRTTFTR